MQAKGTQDDYSIEESTDEEDLAFVIRKANMMMRRKFCKKKSFRKSNIKKDEVGPSNCFECNRPGHIKKYCSNLKDKPTKFKKKKTLYVGWDESKPSDSQNEEKGEEANLSLTNSNICSWQMKIR